MCRFVLTFIAIIDTINMIVTGYDNIPKSIYNPNADISFNTISP